MLKTITNFFVPQFLRNTDQYLLTNNLLVWETRVHWFTFYTLVLNVLLVGAACCVPISFPNDISHFHTLENSLYFFMFVGVCIALLCFVLFVNGLFGRFFKTGFITLNQKIEPLDFFKLMGIYGFMAVLAVLTCSVFHYTLIFRTHNLVNEPKNYALLDKCAKVYEFYQQDTLKIKGFEDINDCIDTKDIGFSRIATNHNYTSGYSDFTQEDPRINGRTVQDIETVPVTRALYAALPHNIVFYKIDKGSFRKELIKVERDNTYREGDIIADSMEITQESSEFYYVNIRVTKPATIAKYIEAQTLGVELADIKNWVEQTCMHTHYTLPHTELEAYQQKTILDKDTVFVDAVQKKINKYEYSSMERYSHFWYNQMLAVGIALLVFTLLLLTLHANKSVRFITFLPLVVPFITAFVGDFQRGMNVLLVSFVFYLVFAGCIVAFHRKAYFINPFRLAIWYICGFFAVCVPLLYFNLVPNLDYIVSTKTFRAYVDIIFANFFILHTLLYAVFFWLRNTRFAILTPFLYASPFIWAVLGSLILGYKTGGFTKGNNVALDFFNDYPIAFVAFFLILNLLTAPFLLSAIVKQTQAPN